MRRAAILSLLALVPACLAKAQQNFVPGFAGLKIGTMAPPALYAAAFYWNLSGGSYVTGGGNTIALHPGLTEQLAGVSVQWVTKTKILGGDYALTASFLGSTARTQLDSIGVNNNVPWGITSTYVQPIALGWHGKRADFTVGYAVYLPTGSYTFNQNSNNGLGMWTQEITAGTTLYLTSSQSIHFALMAYYDINSAKKDTTYRQSNPFTLQGGLGVNFGSKLLAGWAGIVGYAQWTASATTYRITSPAPATLTGPYAQAYGVGPEITTLQGALTLRYLWGVGAKSALQSNIFFVQFGMPI